MIPPESVLLWPLGTLRVHGLVFSLPPSQLPKVEGGIRQQIPFPARPQQGPSGVGRLARIK